MHITIRDGEKFYRASVSPLWAERHNNYALVSIGLTVGKDLTRRAFDDLRRRNPSSVKEIDREDYNHSGCQSSCIRRGGSTCRW